MFTTDDDVNVISDEDELKLNPIAKSIFDSRRKLASKDTSEDYMTIYDYERKIVNTQSWSELVAVCSKFSDSALTVKRLSQVLFDTFKRYASEGFLDINITTAQLLAAADMPSIKAPLGLLTLHLAKQGICLTVVERNDDGDPIILNIRLSNL